MDWLLFFINVFEGLNPTTAPEHKACDTKPLEPQEFMGLGTSYDFDKHSYTITLLLPPQPLLLVGSEHQLDS